MAEERSPDVNKKIIFLLNFLIGVVQVFQVYQYIGGIYYFYVEFNDSQQMENSAESKI